MSHSNDPMSIIVNGRIEARMQEAEHYRRAREVEASVRHDADMRREPRQPLLWLRRFVLRLAGSAA